jgi:parvulin-like peptidyl-prolyl isomerase
LTRLPVADTFAVRMVVPAWVAIPPATACSLRELLMSCKRLIVICSTLAVAGAALSGVGGCAQDSPPVGSPVERVWESPPPAAVAEESPAPTGPPPGQTLAEQGRPATQPASATRPQDSAAELPSVAVAIVNGETIGRARLVDMLIDSHGISVLEQLILLTAARQRAEKLSITLTAADIKAAEEDALRRIAAPVGNPEGLPLDLAAAERLLEDFLRLKGLSRTEWACRMEQRAYLSRIAQAEVGKMEITEAMLKDEYALAYGERVQIRHIQAATHNAINRAAELLATKPFEQVAAELSENPITREQGGLMPPFTRHDGAVPPLVREKAFTMNVGETSVPLREGAWYHIIRVERKFPASGVGFENVEPQTLRQRLTDRLVRQRTDELDSELFQSARIQIRDPRLEKQFREKHQNRK